MIAPPRRLRIAALWAVAGLGLGLAAAATVPALFGYQSLTVLSGSMEPTVHTGDVVVVERIAPTEARIGDVVSFRDPEDPTRVLTHRVRELRVEGGTVRFVTKGDANTGTERWQVASGGTIGRVAYRLWALGYALHWLQGRLARLVLLVIPALLLGLHEIRRIWRPRRVEEVGATPA